MNGASIRDDELDFCFHTDYFITEYLFSKKGAGSKRELNYTYTLYILITLLTAFYKYLCIVKSFK